MSFAQYNNNNIYSLDPPILLPKESKSMQSQRKSSEKIVTYACPSNSSSTALIAIGIIALIGLIVGIIALIGNFVF